MISDSSEYSALALLKTPCLSYDYIHWHPSVSKDYGVALWLVILEQRRVWLESPIREWQSFSHSEQMWSIADPSPWFRAFLVRVSLCLSLSNKCLFKLGKALPYRSVLKT